MDLGPCSILNSDRDVAVGRNIALDLVSQVSDFLQKFDSCFENYRRFPGRRQIIFKFMLIIGNYVLQILDVCLGIKEM